MNQLKRLTPLVFLILTLIFASGCTIQLPWKIPKETRPPEPNSQLTQSINEYIENMTDSYSFSGSVLISHKGEILLKKGYGMANIDWNEPNTPDTVFRIASLTKGFTALALLQFEEQGLLSLKDPLSKYIPDFPRGNQVTLEQLLMHTSGIRDYTASAEFPSLMGSPANLSTVISRIKAQPYDFIPGTQFHYNNSGYILLGAVLEKVSGKPYGSVLDEGILKPLGMAQTAYDDDRIPIKQLATGYLYTGGKLFNAPDLDLSNVHAAGGMRSTLNDLFIWSQAFYSTELLKEENWNRLFTPGREHYGMGWVIEPLAQKKAIYHTGSIPGYSSILAKFPEDDLTIILLSNLTSINTKEMTENLANIVWGQTLNPFSNLKPVEVEPTILAQYTGEYRLALAYTATISLKEGKLFAQLTGQPEFELVPVSNNRFIVENLDIEVNFIQSGGKTERLIVKQEGREMSARKIR